MIAQTPIPFPDADLRRDVTETDDFAYILGPSLHIAEGKVLEAKWSEDDQFLTYQVESKDGVAVSLWNRKTRKSTRLLVSEVPVATTFQSSAKVVWLASYRGSEKFPLYRASLDSGKLETVIQQTAQWTVTPAPAGSAALIVDGEVKNGRRQVLTYANGSVDELTLPPAMRVAHGTTHKGRLALENLSETGSKVMIVDPASGKLTETTEPDDQISPSQTYFWPTAINARTPRGLVPTFWLRVSEYVLRPNAPGAEEKIYSKHMPSSDYMMAMIGADVRASVIGPKRSMLVYWNRDNLLAREIKSIRQEDFLGQYAAWEEKKLSDQVKQVGAAMQVYSQDADDFLPPLANTLDMLSPYTKDPGILEGFRYAMNGQNLSALDNKAGTELGRVLGRSGRAIVYADGHVIWEPRKRP